MLANRQVNEYQKNAVLSASPVQLIVMLYDGALRFMEAGRQAMIGKKLEDQNAQLQKAQKIIIELMGCLDMNKGGEIAQNLFGLYNFVLDELVASNLNDDPTRIENAAKVLRELREGWVGVDHQVRTQELSHAA